VADNIISTVAGIKPMSDVINKKKKLLYRFETQKD
jgi:hypothetical protein